MSQINRTSVQEPGAVAEMSASITQMIFDGVLFSVVNVEPHFPS